MNYYETTMEKCKSEERERGQGCQLVADFLIEREKGRGRADWWCIRAPILKFGSF